MLHVDERYYTVSEIADRLRVDQATVREWLESGRLQGVRLPGGWRVH